MIADATLARFWDKVMPETAQTESLVNLLIGPPHCEREQYHLDRGPHYESCRKLWLLCSALHRRLAGRGRRHQRLDAIDRAIEGDASWSLARTAWLRFTDDTGVPTRIQRPSRRNELLINYPTRWLRELARAADTLNNGARQNAVWLIKEVFGNPFRVVTPVAEYVTPEMRDLAAATYRLRKSGCVLDGRALYVLCDGLEENGLFDEACPRCNGRGTEIENGAGFEYESTCSHCKGKKRLLHPVLEHLRKPLGLFEEHVRGCWALDLVLQRPWR